MKVSIDKAKKKLYLATEEKDTLYQPIINFTLLSGIGILALLLWDTLTLI